MHSFIHSFIHACIPSFIIRAFIQHYSCIHSFILHSFICSFIPTFIHGLSRYGRSFIYLRSVCIHYPSCSWFQSPSLHELRPVYESHHPLFHQVYESHHPPSIRFMMYMVSRLSTSVGPDRTSRGPSARWASGGRGPRRSLSKPSRRA